MGERNYARFYLLLKRMKGADKETLVEQYTNSRTTHLHEMQEWEYGKMCNDMERVSGFDEQREALRRELRRKRSLCLKLMQQLGIDTTDWAAINNFCQNARVSGKPFARISIDELKALQVKLMMIKKHGGLKKQTTPDEPSMTTIYIPINNITES